MKRWLAKVDGLTISVFSQLMLFAGMCFFCFTLLVGLSKPESVLAAPKPENTSSLEKRITVVEKENKQQAQHLDKLDRRLDSIEKTIANISQDVGIRSTSPERNLKNLAKWIETTQDELKRMQQELKSQSKENNEQDKRLKNLERKVD